MRQLADVVCRIEIGAHDEGVLFRREVHCRLPDVGARIVYLKNEDEGIGRHISEHVGCMSINKNRRKKWVLNVCERN